MRAMGGPKSRNGRRRSFRRAVALLARCLFGLWLSAFFPLLALGQTQPDKGAALARHVAGPSAPIALLTQVKQIRQLKPEQASRSIPVRLTGVVTAFSGWKNSFFFQDATAGISVDRTDSAEVHTGDLVEIRGTSAPGLFAPVVMASVVKVIGKASPPTARRVNFGDMFGGVQDSQWVEMEGIIHSGRITQIDGHTVLTMDLEIGGGSVTVLIHDYLGLNFQKLIDAKVRIRGVCASDFNQKRQFVGLEVYVPRRQYLEVLEAASQDPFAAPALPVRNVLQFGLMQHRVKVTGISTYQVAGHALYLQDGVDGIRVQTTSREWIGPGRRVEAVGFPVMGEYAPILQDGFLRDMGPAPNVTPLRIEARDVLGQREGFDQVPYDEQLVQLQGKVAESHIEGGQRVWILR